MTPASLADRVRDIQTGTPGLDAVIDLVHAGRLPEAAVAMQPILDQPGAGPSEWYWAAVLCHQMRRYDGACAMFESVLDAWPDFGPALYNAGVAWECQGRYEAAASRYRRAIAQWGPTSPAVPPLVNLAGCLYRLGKAEDGYDAHSRALDVDCTGDDEALTARSAVRLLRGDYARGFAEYESRRRLGQFRSANWAPAFGAPWEGQKTRTPVLLYHEQGAGDTIQMLRYAADVERMSGCPVILCVQPELKRLCEGWHRQPWAIKRVITRAELDPKRHHWHAPLMSLPYLTGHTDVVPSAPYLKAAARPAGKPPLAVGLCWKGNPEHNNDRDRSVPSFDVLKPLLAAFPHVRWVSLQQGAAAPFSPALAARDFAETADIVAGLDLVITIDSAVAHLAGALGVPTWILVPTAPEWRWGLGESTPWYPSATLYRRRSTTEWGEMVGRIAADLGRLV